MKTIKLSLTKQLLFIAVLPFAIQAAMLFAINFQFLQEQQKLETLVSDRRAELALGDYFYWTVQYGMTLVLYVQTHGMLGEESFVKPLKKIESHISALQQWAGADKRKQESLLPLKQLKAQFQNMVADAKKEIGDSNIRESTLTDARQNRLRAISDALESDAALAKEIGAPGKISADELAQARQTLWSIVFLAAVLNICLVVFLGTAGYQYVNAKLERLQDACRQLANGNKFTVGSEIHDEYYVLMKQVERVSEILFDAKQRVQQLVATCADGIIILTKTGNVSFANQVATSQFNLDTDISAFETVEQINQKELKSAVEKAQQNSTPVNLRFENGGKYVHWHLVKEHERLFCLVRDVSRQMRFEKAKTTLFDIVQRRLQTPMTEIVSSLQQMELDLSIDEKIRHDLKRSIINAERISQLVDELASLRLVEQSDFVLVKETISLKEMLESVVDSVTSLAAERSVRVELNSTSQTIFADRLKLEEVLVNLLANAIRFSPQDESISVSTSTSDGMLNISIRDRGQGIKEQQMQNIFAPYFRGEHQAKLGGAGLGLAISKMIMVAHGGEITVKNANPGAEFTLTLPTSSN